MFAVLKKGQLLFVVIAFVLVISTSFLANKAVPAANMEDSASAQFVVVLDAGHGGIDPGGIGIATKVKEADLNLTIVFKLKQLLESMGINVVLTRADANGLYHIYTKRYKKEDMAKRKEIIEKARPDLVVSVHMNRYTNPSLRGAQAFYDETNEQGKLLAEFVQTEFNEKLEATNRESTFGDYFMVKCTDAPSIIAECGFLSNKTDEALLINPEYQDRVAYTIFCGIIRYLNHTETMQGYTFNEVNS